jgi:hypothetical protein
MDDLIRALVIYVAIGAWLHATIEPWTRRRRTYLRSQMALLAAWLLLWPIPVGMRLWEWLRG